MAYGGPLGAGAAHALALFGLAARAEDDPADTLLEDISRDPDAAAARYAASALAGEVRAAVLAAAPPGKTAYEVGGRAPVATRLRLLVQRELRVQWRDRIALPARFGIALLVAVFLGLLYREQALGGGPSAVTAHVASIFFFAQSGVIVLVARIVPVINTRTLLHREAVACAMYSRPMLWLAELVVAGPVTLVCSLPGAVIMYFMLGFVGSLLLWVVVAFLVAWLIPGLGQLLANVSKDSAQAVALAGLLISFSGLAVTLIVAPKNFAWFNWMNMMRYVLQGPVTSELLSMRLELPRPWLNYILAFATSLRDAGLSNLPELVDAIERNISDLHDAAPVGYLVLWLLGWADDVSVSFLPFTISATTYTWFYPVTALVVFLVAIELAKLVTLSTINWVKR